MIHDNNQFRFGPFDGSKVLCTTPKAIYSNYYQFISKVLHLFFSFSPFSSSLRRWRRRRRRRLKFKVILNRFSLREEKEKLEEQKKTLVTADTVHSFYCFIYTKMRSRFNNSPLTQWTSLFLLLLHLLWKYNYSSLLSYIACSALYAVCLIIKNKLLCVKEFSHLLKVKSTSFNWIKLIEKKMIIKKTRAKSYDSHFFNWQKERKENMKARVSLLIRWR